MIVAVCTIMDIGNTSLLVIGNDGLRRASSARLRRCVYAYLHNSYLAHACHVYSGASQLCFVAAQAL